MVPNMPSFQTSLRYSDFGIGIIGQYRRGWRSGSDTGRGCFSKGDSVIPPMQRLNKDYFN